MSFHEIRFPTAISRGATGGPERRTDVVALGSGHEERNSRWADLRRAYNAGYGVKTLDDLHAVVAFFEERRGHLSASAGRTTRTSARACPPPTRPFSTNPSASATVSTTFPLVKQYGALHAPWQRRIAKPVAGSVLVAVDGTPQTIGTAVLADATTGILTFQPDHIPAEGAVVSAGFEFDVPVRFDSDKLEVSLHGFSHGAIPSIPIVEIRL